MNPLDIPSNLLFRSIEKNLDPWIRLSFSLSATAIITFLGVWGGSVWALHAEYSIPLTVLLSLADASIATAATLLFIWRQLPLTKDIPLAVPGRVDAALQAELVKDGMVTSGKS